MFMKIKRVTQDDRDNGGVRIGEKWARCEGGKVGRVISFASAQDDNAANGTDNKQPRVTHYPTSILGKTEPQDEAKSEENR